MDECFKGDFPPREIPTFDFRLPERSELFKLIKPDGLFKLADLKSLLLEHPLKIQPHTYEPANENFAPTVPLSLSGIINCEGKTGYGAIIRSTTHVWSNIVGHLSTNWSAAYEIPAQKWEELIAGAFDKAGYDEVTITPRSGDHGRDVIAIKRGVGSIKIINSVKAYRPGHLVGYDDVRALLGVMSGERDTSKGIMTTTSDFPPLITKDPFIAPFLPTRLELMNGVQLHQWLTNPLRKQAAND